MNAADGSSAQWEFVHDNGRVYGPISTDQVIGLCRSGVIQPATAVRSTLFADWVEAGTVGALRAAMEGTTRPGSIDSLLAAIPFQASAPRPAAPQRQGQSDRPTFLAVVVLFLASAGLGWLNWQLNPSGRTSVDYRMGYAMGSAVGVFILGFLIGWLFSLVSYLVPSHRKLVAITTFSLGAGAVVLLSLVGQLARVAVVKRDAAALQQLKSDVREIAREAQANLESKPGSTTLPIATSTAAVAPLPNDATDNERLLQIVRQLNSEITNCAATYRAAIQSLQFQESLSPQQLLDPEARVKTRRKCDVAAEALAKYETSVRNLIHDVPSRLVKAGISEPARRSFMVGFQSSTSGRQSFEKIAYLEHQILNEMTGMLDMMDDVGNRARIQGGRLIFASQDDLRAWQARTGRMVQLAAQEETVQKQAIQQMTSFAGGQ